MFQYQVDKPPAPRPTRTKVSRSRDRIVEALAAIDQAAALLDDTSPERVAARKQIDHLQTLHAELTTVLDALPKK